MDRRGSDIQCCGGADDVDGLACGLFPCHEPPFLNILTKPIISNKQGVVKMENLKFWFGDELIGELRSVWAIPLARWALIVTVLHEFAWARGCSP